jgi:hypothetical protein
MCKAIMLIAFISLFNSGISQSFNDSSIRKNNIKVDLTSMAIYNNAFNVTYERVLKSNRTLGITAGYQELPSILSIIGNDSMTTTQNSASGFKFAVDYRFYLGKENRYSAPHGVFIGPYVAYHQFSNDWNLTIKGNSGPQTGTIEGKFNVLNMGFQAGYQFVINNRWSVDMSFIGVSFSNYRARMNVNGNFDIDDSQISEDLLEAISNKFPLIGELIEEGEVDQTGRLDTWGFGYRYIVNVGYAFGGGSTKKKAKTN